MKEIIKSTIMKIYRFIDDRVICRVNYFGGDYNFGLKFINYELNQGLIANYKMG